jgi:replicative DNA helicase
MSDFSISQAEKKILGEMINDPTVIDDVLLNISFADFSDKKYKLIFLALTNLHRSSKKVTDITLINYFDNNKEMQFDDYTNTINDIYYSYLDSSDYESLVEVIKINSANNKLELLSDFIKNDGKVNSETFDNNFDVIRKKLDEIQFASIKNDATHASELSEIYTTKYKSITSGSKKNNSISTGFSNLDKITHGMTPGELIILAARPGSGKTAFSLNILINAAKKIKAMNEELDDDAKKGIILYFSLEMKKEELHDRNINIEAKFNPGRGSDVDKFIENEARMLKAAEKMKDLPFFVIDKSSISANDIHSQCRIFNNKGYKVMLVIVDYIGIMSNEKSSKFTSREQEVSQNVRSLKQLAKNFDLPVLALAQLSREMEKRDKPKVYSGYNESKLSDLRDSGSLEQEADMV